MVVLKQFTIYEWLLILINEQRCKASRKYFVNVLGSIWLCLVGFRCYRDDHKTWCQHSYQHDSWHDLLKVFYITGRRRLLLADVGKNIRCWRVWNWVGKRVYRQVLRHETLRFYILHMNLVSIVPYNTP